MEFMNQRDAILLLNIISSTVVPFITTMLTQVQWSRWAKIALALSISLFAAFINVIATGTDVTAGTIVGATLTVLGFATVNYNTWFISLRLDNFLNTQTGAVNDLETIVSRAVASDNRMSVHIDERTKNPKLTCDENSNVFVAD